MKLGASLTALTVIVNVCVAGRVDAAVGGAAVVAQTSVMVALPLAFGAGV